jgi:hypothetical protein
MRGIVQPTRCAARMREWNVRNAIPHARPAHRIFERNSSRSPEPIDGDAAEEKDHPGLKMRELLIEP